MFQWIAAMPDRFDAIGGADYFRHSQCRLCELLWSIAPSYRCANPRFNHVRFTIVVRQLGQNRVHRWGQTRANSPFSGMSAPIPSRYRIELQQNGALGPGR